MDGTRTYSWVDPQEMAKLSRELDGLEFNRHLLEAGEAGIMPIAATLGFRLAEVELASTRPRPAHRARREQCTHHPRRARHHRT